MNCSYNSLKSEGLKEERVVLLEAWKQVEQESQEKGGEGDVESVIHKFPRKIKKRRMVNGDEGEVTNDEVEWEEYYDYHFPDDEKKIGKKKLSIDVILFYYSHHF